jgi:GH25 family lysozyme M1 (1,4-beta-N-acetylmuramidase)
MKDGVTPMLRGLIAGTGTCAIGLAVLFSGGGVAVAAGSPAATGLAPISHPEADTMGSGIRAHEQAMQAESSKTADARGELRRAYSVAEQTFGHDVSNWQPNINWPATAAAGAKFVYIKATESTTFRNPIFASQYNGAYGAGIIRGA